jgi:ABC-type transport system substrate-binding protein
MVIFRQIICLLDIVSLVVTLVFTIGAQTSPEAPVIFAIPDTFSTLDTLTSSSSDGAAERLRLLLFNSLVKKTKDLDYAGELASEIITSKDGKAVTFILRSDIKFHDGSLLTSSDVKYTFDKLFESSGFKSFAFTETVKNRGTWKAVRYIDSIKTPDSSTVIFALTRPGLKDQLLANLAAIPIIRSGTSEQLNSLPVGTGPFRFVSLDRSQNVVELEANSDYWDGAPTISRIRIKSTTDASELQTELQSGAVDIAAFPSYSPPGFLETLRANPNLKIDESIGTNIQYLGFNTKSFSLNNVKIRRAIGYAIDREKIIREVLQGHAKPAHSILPETSWAYATGVQYNFNPTRARKLIREANYKNGLIVLKISANYGLLGQYAQAVQHSLQEVGLNVRIEKIDAGTLRMELARGEFQMTIGTWIGGNQDPLFLRDLFSTSKIPRDGVSCCNRSRYSKQEVDMLLDQATIEEDRTKAVALYSNAWGLISNDLPVLPLWYPANIVVSDRRIGNIELNEIGDMSFVKDLTINK